jgi:GntR family transcriptional regulator
VEVPELPIDLTSDRAVFRQIADELRQEIKSGTLPPGARMPSERELMTRFGASRGTIRQALAVLSSEGLTDVQHGRGVFVRKRPPIMRLSSERFSRRLRDAGKGAFQAETEAHGFEPRQEILELGVVPAPAYVASRLGVHEGARVFVRRRRMWADDVPMQLADSYFRYGMVRGTPIVEEDAGPGGSYARLEELGYRLARFREDLVARMPSPEEARGLQLGPGVPVVSLIRTAYDAEGRPVEVFDSVVAGDKHTFSYEIPAD